MRSFLSFVILSILFVFSGIAQSVDSVKISYYNKSTFIKKQILPISLITTGTLLNIGSVKTNIQNQIPNTNTNIDDYLQFAPIAQIYLFDAMGYKHQNTVFDQTKYLFISQLISNSLVFSLKNITKVQRPMGDNRSFPSGHTANAFCGATVLFHEFKDDEPVLAYSGYLFATATGILRTTNNAHWLPDVLVGAGIGVLSANLVYHFKPLRKFQPFKKNKNLVFTPVISTNSLGLQCRF
jgi:membrane-associated phospholipid phosphatase